MNATVTFLDCEFDESLWAAYHRHDKVAVTEKLLGHVAAAKGWSSRHQEQRPSPLGSFRKLQRSVFQGPQ
jgi:hypothetical protein